MSDIYSSSFLRYPYFDSDIMNKITNTKTFDVYKLRDKDYGSFQVIDGEIIFDENIGVITSRYLDNRINQPVKVVWDDNEALLWVFSYDRPIAKFDNSGNYMGGFGVYGNGLNKYYQLSSGDVIYYGGQRYVATVSLNRRQVKLFDSTGIELWSFGVDGSAGNVDTGRLRAPRGIIQGPELDLGSGPEGTVIIIDYNGGTSSTLTYGTVSLHKLSDGTLVDVILKYENGGDPWNMGVTYPYGGFGAISPSDGNYHLFIPYYSKAYVARFMYDFSDSTWKYQRIYEKPSNLPYGSLNPNSVFVDFNNNVIYSSIDGKDVVSKMDLDTGELLGYIGTSAYEDSSLITPSIARFWSPNSVTLENDYIYISDYTNRKVVKIPVDLIVTDSVVIEYELDGQDDVTVVTELATTNQDFDKDTQTLSVQPTYVLNNEIPQKIYVIGDLN